MKINRVTANNRKKAFEVKTPSGMLLMPYARTSPRPTSNNGVVGVIVDPDNRRTMILSQMNRIAKEKKGHVHEDEALLEQAVFSVEMPEVLIGSFNPQHLALPQDVLMTSMKEHQGYFSLLKKDHGLLPYFVAVVNMKGSISSSHYL